VHVVGIEVWLAGDFNTEVTEEAQRTQRRAHMQNRHVRHPALEDLRSADLKIGHCTG
jgi:hypothetical protein